MGTELDTRVALQRLTLFADVLSPGQLDEFARRCRLCFFAQGSVLMHQGDFGSSMFGILNGQASVTFVDNRANGNSVAVLSPGEVVGEMAMLTGDRRSATVLALTNVECLEIPRQALEVVFAQSPELMDAFAASLARRKTQLDRFAVEHGKPGTFLAQIRKLFGTAAVQKPLRET